MSETHHCQLGYFATKAKIEMNTYKSICTVTMAVHFPFFNARNIYICIYGFEIRHRFYESNWHFISGSQRCVHVCTWEGEMGQNSREEKESRSNT